jgi:hypothetical protein
LESSNRLINQTSGLLRLRWLAVLLIGLLWATMGSTAALAERGDFDRSLIAANSAVQAENAAQGAMLRMQLGAEEVAGARLPSSFGGYTDHGLQQVLGRDGGLGVADTAVLDAFNNPVSIVGQTGKYGGAFKMTGQNATIVVNPHGQVITGYGTNSAGLRVP